MSTATVDTPRSFDELAAHVDTCLADVKALPTPERDKALALKEALDALHNTALTKLVKRLKDDPHGKALLFDAVDEPEIYALFLMHNIIKPPIETRVGQALAQVQPYVQSHGGDVELVRIENRVAYVRLHGSCSGCSMSAQTLKNGIEDAIVRHVPDIERVEEVQGDVAGFIALESIGQMTAGASLAELGWVMGPLASEVTEGKPQRVAGEGYDALVVRHEGRLFAYRNACPHMGLTLERGMCEGRTLTCPWHGFTFDVTSGECLSAPHVQLQPYPLRLEQERVWLRPE